MTRRGPAWRAALRQARRDVTRSRGRSLLVGVMIGTPVLLTVALSAVISSADVSAAENVPATMGRAGAVVAPISQGGIEQDVTGQNWSTLTDGGDTLPRLEEAGRIAGGPLLRIDHSYGTVRWTTGGKPAAAASDVVQTALRDPLAQGLVTMVSGRLPEADDEAVVSPAIADRGLGVGDMIRVEPAQSSGQSSGSATRLRIVGVGGVGSVAVDHDTQTVATLVGALPLDRDATQASALVDAAVPWSTVRELNAAGFAVTSREVLEHPPSSAEQYAQMRPQGGSTPERALAVLVVTAILIEVVLLAGPAFAVGVRRQRRELALLAASGATPRDVRRVVLAQAIVLGVLACAVGAVLGVALAVGVVAWTPTFTTLAFGPFELRPLPVVVAAVLGVVAAVLAAWVPARQVSRQDVAAVLAGRRGTVRGSRGWPVLGLVLAAAGVAVCFTLGTRQGGELWVAAGTVVVVLGVVLVTPVVVGALGRLAGAAPVPLRIALRDSARQRARSAPAVAAIMAAVAGLTAIAIASSSDFEQSRREYVYEAAPGRTLVDAGTDRFDDVVRTAEQTSGVRFVGLSTPGRPDGSDTWSVQDDGAPRFADRGIVVADADTLAAWGVRLDAQQRRALDDGRVLASPGVTVGGAVTLVRYDANGEEVDPHRFDTVAADLTTGSVPRGERPGVADVVLSPVAARGAGIAFSPTRAISATGAPVLTDAQTQAVQDAVSAVDPGSSYVRTERGFQESYGIVLLVLVTAGAAAVLIGSLTATGLALSDARPDFSTLASVGASPRVRRLVAGSQAAVLAGTGALLGVAVGFVPGLAATWPLTSVSYASGVASAGGPVVEIPWAALLGIGVAVPLLASLVALAATRSRLPIVRRLAQ